MGVQMIVDGSELASAERGLATIWKACEVFPMVGGEWGIAIPAELFEKHGEVAMARALRSFGYLDLWAGQRSERQTDRHCSRR